MNESWDLIDIHRNPTGETWIRGTKAQIPQGKFHVIVSVWTVTRDGKILITKRHSNKSFGGMWENTGGAVISGETSLEAAARELKEETGLDKAQGTLTFLGDVWHIGYVVDTYLFTADFEIDDLSLQPEEVVAAKFATRKDIEKLHTLGQIVLNVYRTFCNYRKEITGE